MRNAAWTTCVRFLVAVTIAAGWAQNSNASELRWTHFGVRPLGMGNAFVGQADDFNALYYNPAGLAWLNTWTFEVLSLRGEVSANTTSAISDISSFASSGSGSTDATIQLIQKQGGKPLGFNLGLEPFFVMPHFGFALALEMPTQLTFHNDITFDVNAGPRLYLPVGMAFSFFRNRLAAGFNVKALGQLGVDRSFDIDSLNNLTSGTSGSGSLEDYVLGGYGIGFDTGILFRPEPKNSTTLGISVLDVGGTAFKAVSTGTATTGAPETRQPSINTGISFKPVKTAAQYISVNADVAAINQRVHYSKKVNLGAEYGLGEFLKVQAGLHQGEWTAGLQLDIMLLKLRFATYAEQLGTAAGQDQILSDRRYAMHLNLLL
ncbi:hypothetical protein EBZ80_08440 [bacterium]|nr:hypothetical protein [bacterium]